MNNHEVTLRVDEIPLAAKSFTAEDEEAALERANRAWDRELQERGIGSYTLSIRRLRPRL